MLRQEGAADTGGSQQHTGDSAISVGLAWIR